MNLSTKIKYLTIIIIAGMILIIIKSCKKEASIFSDDEPIADINGNSYKTVKIGTQVWMAENLRTTNLNEGTLITKLPFGETWSGITGPGYWGSGGCTFYNGYSINTSKLCPIGWHVPTSDDVFTLIKYLGGVNVAGNKMKKVGAFNWPKNDEGATNLSGFSAIACGYRLQEGSGYAWLGQGENTAFFSIGGFYSLGNGIESVHYESLLELYYNTGTHNVRCVKNRE
jgi:uncharacterized protein (TIGR02145 family)